MDQLRVSGFTGDITRRHPRPQGKNTGPQNLFGIGSPQRNERDTAISAPLAGWYYLPPWDMNLIFDSSDFKLQSPGAWLGG